MNLLYLTIIIPLLSFLLLVCIGRYIHAENVIIIGIGTLLIVLLLTIFTCIDYGMNTVPDMTMIYSRTLWDWFSIDDFVVPITLSLDGLSLIFLVIIVLFGLLIYIFAALYLTSIKDIYTFYAYSNLLIASILTQVLVDNLLVMLIGWEGISISTYLLIGIYYNQLRNGYAAVKAFVTMHLTDLFLLVGIFILYQEVGTLNIRELLTAVHDNLAVDSDVIFWITVMLFLGAISKSALFPMQTWFIETTLAPMPAVALMQSSTVILAGVYLILRLSSLFMMSSDIMAVMMVLAAIAVIFSSTISLAQYDIKRIITYINLSQISYLFWAFSTQNWSLALNFLIIYAVTSALLILSSAILIKMCHGERDISKLGGLVTQAPILYGCFLFSALSLSAMPWLSSAFYVKGDIIWGLMSQGNLVAGTIGLLGILLSSLSILRLIFIVFHHKRKIHDIVTIKLREYIPLFILALFTTALFIYFPLPTQGVVPIVDLNTDGRLPFQLLLAAVTLLSFLIAYIFYAHPNSEIQEIINTPMIKLCINLFTNEWRFDYFVKKGIVRPYLYLADLVKKDPLAKWDNWVLWSVKKINSHLVNLENGRLRWYMMSIVMGSIIVLMLLVFV
ncbi:proton-conducting transporter membrane subunit [Orbaceae bacterium ESL0727]|nr:proton-conducting transporter membrane subunit [Orbaceae bacterium ESL0727]